MISVKVGIVRTDCCLRFLGEVSRVDVVGKWDELFADRTFFD